MCQVPKNAMTSLDAQFMRERKFPSVYGSTERNKKIIKSAVILEVQIKKISRRDVFGRQKNNSWQKWVSKYRASLQPPLHLCHECDPTLRKEGIMTLIILLIVYILGKLKLLIMMTLAFRSAVRAWQEPGMSLIRAWQEPNTSLARAWHEPGTSLVEIAVGAEVIICCRRFFFSTSFSAAIRREAGTSRPMQSPNYGALGTTMVTRGLRRTSHHYGNEGFKVAHSGETREPLELPMFELRAG